MSIPVAILIGFFALGLVIIIGAKLVKQSVWEALTAFGTIGAVIVALFYPIFHEWRVSPSIEISPPDYATGYLRSAQEYGGVMPFFFIDLKLKNTGKSMAKSSQPFISAVGEEVQGKWQKLPNWVPTPVYWVLDDWEEKAGGKPTAERDLIPLRPYYFTIGYLTPKYPDTLGLSRTIIATGQSEAFKPGKYCFEVTAYALDAEPITKYFLITWKGQCPAHLRDLPASIEVKEVTRKLW
jgi:hypothetical protein